MNYPAVLFLHVLGAIATFAGVCAWLFSVITLRQAQRQAEIRAVALIYRMGTVLGLLGIVAVAASGSRSSTVKKMVI